ncbi:MAG: TatD family hydrolase [Bacteroidetes bacterium]|nr:TatD family hydrolase [Bacteroidota bacterium]
MDNLQNTWINVHTHQPSGVGVEIVNLFPDKVNEAPLPDFCSIGLHPWYIDEQWEKKFQVVADIARDHAVYAIGETGLDKLAKTPMDLQMEVFRKHIALSEQLQKPLVIHCVKAFNELVQLKKDIHPTVSWIVHGFNKNLQTADMLIRHEIYLSFGRALLDPSSNAAQVLPQMPDEVFLLETDDADTPISDIYLAAAGLVNLSPEKMKDLMYLNFINCFRV